MKQIPHKLTFDEVIQTSSVFYNDEAIEQRFEDLIKNKAKQVVENVNASSSETTKEEVTTFLRRQPDGLARILSIIHLSEEKFKRIISLVRKLDGTFDIEWDLKRIAHESNQDDGFCDRLASILLDGKDDERLKKYLPRLYRERLSLKSLKEFLNEEELIVRLKDRYIGTYSNWKGDAIEEIIRKRIENTGFTYSAGMTSLVDVTVDWAIPNLEDPYVIIMSSYQETTSSSQSEKARGMMRCFKAIQHRNIQRGESRAFVNFVDGGGWLARQRDLKRLVDGCHYFLNMNTLDMFEEIILKHVPRTKKQTKMLG